jgi:hypothetical protein
LSEVAATIRARTPSPRHCRWPRLQSNTCFPLPDTAPACVAELEELERLKSAICARQAKITARLDEPDLRAAGTSRITEKAMATEVGLARHESPSRGSRLLRLARALVDDHPLVLGLLECGDLNERRAEIIVNETSHLDVADRRVADAAIVDKLAQLPCLGDRDLAEETRRIVHRLDAEAAERRRAKALRDRHVRARTRGDGTGEVTGVVADWQAAAIMASLGARADLLIAQGDERTRAQILADLYVERLAGLLGASGVPVPCWIGRRARHRVSTRSHALAGSAVSLAQPGRPHADRSFLAAGWPSHSPTPTTSSPWNPGPGFSPSRWVSSSGCATGGVAPRGATPPCATSTTSTTPPPADRPPSTTAKDSACPATTRSSTHG